jgi:hypothetical protein
MSDITESCSAVLEVGREKLSEGDYLKLATFLSTIHASKSALTVVNEKWVSHNFKLEYNTIKSKKCMVIKIDNLVEIVKRTDAVIDIELHVIGSINNEPFRMLRKEFINKIIRRISFYGMRNIKRTMDDMDDEFVHYSRFKGHTRDRASDMEEDDDDSDWDLTEYTIVGELFCLDVDLFDTL